MSAVAYKWKQLSPKHYRISRRGPRGLIHGNVRLQRRGWTVFVVINDRKTWLRLKTDPTVDTVCAPFEACILALRGPDTPNRSDKNALTERRENRVLFAKILGYARICLVEQYVLTRATFTTIADSYNMRTLDGLRGMILALSRVLPPDNKVFKRASDYVNKVNLHHKVQTRLHERQRKTQGVLYDAR